MKVLSKLLPQDLRDRGRQAYDSFYCKSAPDKETIGDGAKWTIVTRDMRPDAVIYSGGVGEDISFEEELIRRFGVKVHLFDPSPIARRTIELAKNDHLFFQPLGLAAATAANFTPGGGEGDKTWFKTGGENTVACTTIPIEIENNGHTSLDLLKIDIEGFEYEVLESCLSRRIPIKQICVEFHDFFPDIPSQRTKAMIQSLKSSGFELIHRHRHDHTFLHTSAAV